MSLLRHPLLIRLAEKLEHGESALRWIDLYAAQYVADCDHQAADDSLVKLALLASFSSGQGATHLALEKLPLETSLGFRVPRQSVAEWRASLLQSQAVCEAGHDDLPIKAPLVLHQHGLYLARYWRLHERFETWLHAQSAHFFRYPDAVLETLAGSLKKVFKLPEPGRDIGAPDWQAVAAAHTLMQKFTLITGGPGTGKTTTVASILYLLMQRYYLLASSNEQGSNVPVIRLLAPTGKAAVRLAASIQQHLSDIEQQIQLAGDHHRSSDDGFPRLSEYLPETGETIHRFLYQQGALREHLNQTTRFRSDEVLLGKREAQRAAVDIVVIDEASMIDLALMVELINVLPDDVQLIMLGDHHQLPPVEPGQIFADCAARYGKQAYRPEFAQQLSRLTGYAVEALSAEGEGGSTQPSSQPLCQPLSQPLCQLRKTYRFGGELKEAAEWIKAGQSRALKQAYRVLKNGNVNAQDVRWYPLEDSPPNEIEMHRIISAYADYFERIKSQAPLLDLATAFDRFQILCSTHEGPFGVRYLNQLIESHFGRTAALYHGKAILVTRNHPHLGVFNGDIGFVQVVSNDLNALEICFPHARSDDEQDVLRIASGRLREWQPAYAMTVHKSQGSEYQHVCVVLADYAKELLSRELLYTAVTRSKKRCDIWASESAIDRAVSQRAFNQS